MIHKQIIKLSFQVTMKQRWLKVSTFFTASLGSLGNPLTELESIERKTFSWKNIVKNQKIHTYTYYYQRRTQFVVHLGLEEYIEQAYERELESFAINHTWTCQASGLSSFELETSAIPRISGILSILSNESSCEPFIFLSPCNFDAFNQRSSKLVSMS